MVLAFCGLADSAYVVQTEWGGAPLICNTSLPGCTTVAESGYSNLFGIPLAEWGVLFYARLLTLAALEVVLHTFMVRRSIQGLALFGGFVSLGFMLIELFVIRAFCIYCTISAGITFLTLIFAWFLEPVRRLSFVSHFRRPLHLSMPPRH